MPSPSSPSDFWDDKFSRPGYLYGVEPNSWLVSQRYRLKTGMRVLCVGDGEGRNGVWLAQQGMEVMSVDSSPVALRKSMKLAMDRSTKLITHCADLVTWQWPRNTYDAVVAIFIHFPPMIRPAIHEGMAGALRPGGVLLMEAFRPEQVKNGTGGPRDPSLLYGPEILRQDFQGLTMEELAAWEGVLDEGPGHQGQSATTRLVARKPN